MHPRCGAKSSDASTSGHLACFADKLLSGGRALLVHAADHFEVDIRELVNLNLQIFNITPNMTYKYQTVLKLDEMTRTLDVVQQVTQGMLGTSDAPINMARSGAIEPYFVCSYYDKNGKYERVQCDRQTLMVKPPDNEPHRCERNGTVSGGETGCWYDAALLEHFTL
jgi:hypothetical protein